MSTKNVWLVTGGTGEYSDHTAWTVIAYENEAEAQKHCDAAQLAVDGAEHWDYERREHFKNPHDSQCSIDYTGTSYSVEMVEVREKFDPQSPTP